MFSSLSITPIIGISPLPKMTILAHDSPNQTCRPIRPLFMNYGCMLLWDMPPRIEPIEPLGHRKMIEENTIGGCIYSHLGGDPDLRDIVEMFVEEMPGRTASLLDHLNDADWEGLRRAAHQLKGAAGSYGFEPISPSTGRVESAIRDGEPEQHIREAVLALVDLCGRVRSGQPSA